MKLETFINKLKNNPDTIEFSETMETIETNYNFTPTAFKNGDLQNEAGQNTGSCKLFAFAKKQHLSKAETLACFGKFYYEEVLNDPTGTGHQNIRNFIKTGFEGLTFEGDVLAVK
ncbi:type III effector [Tamlana sedimentorum]|uniref:Type III effector n=1 Tax=Neotamlana sedimentorum TaxID=1435349 RepID=A0A0D7WFS6_9FLAO|nr:HopJ type III effector protein [Tamlana sedimentorum]KJD36597.1 type III effector [Tamlana sedimentorum]